MGNCERKMGTGLFSKSLTDTMRTQKQTHTKHLILTALALTLEALVEVCLSFIYREDGNSEMYREGNVDKHF